MTKAYPGNIPGNVARDAKYSVVHGHSGMEVRLIYRVDRAEKALLTTAAHPSLVQMVNDIKQRDGSAPGGAFYINEYAHVLVPTGGIYLYAGPYAPPLEFDFDGMAIGPRPPKDLEPGDDWPGPHVGIPYVLTADGSDIRYEVEHQPGRIRVCRLSEEVGKRSAQDLARRLTQYKGQGGGRIYINESRAFFAPVQTKGSYRYLYIGDLQDDAWFPEPAVDS